MPWFVAENPEVLPPPLPQLTFHVLFERFFQALAHNLEARRAQLIARLSLNPLVLIAEFEQIADRLLLLLRQMHEIIRFVVVGEVEFCVRRNRGLRSEEHTSELQSPM